MVIDNAVGALGLDAVATQILNRKVAQDNIVRRHKQAFARALLPLEAEDSRPRTRSADRYPVDIERQAVGQVEPAGADFHRVARLGIDQRGLQPRLRVGAGFDPDRIGKGGVCDGKKGRGDKKGDWLHPAIIALTRV